MIVKRILTEAGQCAGDFGQRGNHPTALVRLIGFILILIG